MLVSIIIPTYNRKKYLKRAIDSILAQSYANFEIIIVDDGSTDDTYSILKIYNDKRIQYHKIKHSGVSVARNFGIKKARGLLIAFLDSDDEWLKDKLSLQVKEYKKRPYAICHTDEIWVRNNKRVNQKLKHKKGGGEQFFRSLELCCISPSASLVSKGVLDRIGLFKSDFYACEDYDLWLRITAQYKVRYIDKPLIIKYGGHEDQLSKQVSLDFYRIQSMISLLKTKELSLKKQDVLLEILNRKIKIYKNGLLKRNKQKEIHELDKILSNIIY